MTRLFREDDRGASKVLGYILSVAIATALVAGLLIATSGLVDSQAETATETELRVAGDRLAAKLMQADQVAQEDPSASFALEPDVPTDAGGRQYAVEVDIGSPSDPGDERLILTSEEEGLRVIVPMTLKTDVAETETLSGGFVIVRDGGQIELTREGTT